MAGSHDGRVTLSTKLDTSGIQAGAKGIKSALAVSTKAVAALGAAAATAIVAVTKKSVDAYAAYEQLAGGVETLFKQSADKVKAYAEDAYKTAGVSANAYMEAVTSFSASLISSLGGDTEKAAEVANMAMVDMSDNANKMGTPLANIQNAYQGFAKQNYTMLDNLKLGYGGTKTEMERLLKDAEAFSGVKYNINNLSDVYEAIHQIQVKLDVAGTTAKEAESTITGSITMTKSAWENLLTAMSGGGSLDRAIDDFVYSLEKAMQNILPVVERSLVGIGYAIERLAPKLVERIAVALIKAIPSLLNAVYKMIIGLAQGVYQDIRALFAGGTVEVLEEQAEQIRASVENQEALTEEVKETEKVAKKALAGFDELNVLSHGSAGAADSSVGAAPHHTISPAGLSGGGTVPRPGEISLAHNGVLFLDELPEFSRQALEILRQPLEDGKVNITRVAGSLSYDCSFMLVAAMNPCPCGYFGHPTKQCTCSPRAVANYLGRISGPMLDRMDLHIEVPPVDFESLSDSARGESSAVIRERINRARKIQQQRFDGTDVSCNARMSSKMLDLYCPMTDDARVNLKSAFERLDMSARTYDRILKVARTVADIDNSEIISSAHILQAIRFRSLDRKYWSR